jgi:hypothetical protein
MVGVSSGAGASRTRFIGSLALPRFGNNWGSSSQGQCQSNRRCRDRYAEVTPETPRQVAEHPPQPPIIRIIERLAASPRQKLPRLARFPMCFAFLLCITLYYSVLLGVVGNPQASRCCGVCLSRLFPPVHCPPAPSGSHLDFKERRLRPLAPVRGHHKSATLVTITRFAYLSSAS